MAGRFTVEAVFKALDRFTAPVRRMQGVTERAMRGINTASRAVAKSTGAAVKALGSASLAVAATAGAATAGLVAGLKEVVDVGAEFERTMVAAAAKFSPEIRAGTEEFRKLAVAAEGVGATTEFNAQQAALALKDLASAGFGVDQAIGALPGIVNLATAEQMDLAEASNIVTKSLGAFGLASDDAAVQSANLVRITDAMGKAAGVSKTGMTELFEAVKEGGPIATGAGIAMEELLALTAGLAESGIEASVAGTTLKNMVSTLSAPTKEASEVFQELGVKLRDAEGNLLSPIAVLDELNAKIGASPRRIELLEKAFGKIPLAGVVGLLGTGTAKLEQFHTAIKDSAGNTAKLAEVMRNTTSGDIDGFSSAIDGVKVAIFGVVKGPLRGVLKAITDWVGANRELIASGVEKFLGKIGAAAKAVAPLLEKFFEGFGGKFDLSGTIDSVGAGFDELLETIQTPEFEDMAKRWGERLGVVADAATSIAGAIADAVPSVMLLSDALQRPSDQIRELLGGALGKGAGALSSIVGGAATGLRTGIEFVLALPSRLQVAAAAASARISGVFDRVGEMFERLKAFAMPAIEFVVGLAILAAHIVQRMWRPVGAFFAKLWAGVSEKASVVWQALTSAAAAVYARFLDIWSPIALWFSDRWDEVKAGFEMAWSGFVDFMQGIYDGFLDIWNPIVSFFSDIWDEVATTFEETVGGILTRIETAVDFVRSIGRQGLGGDEPDAGGGDGPQLVDRGGGRDGVDVGGTITVVGPKGTTVQKKRGSPVGLDLAPSGGF